jgi:hypothetical protein
MFAAPFRIYVSVCFVTFTVHLLLAAPIQGLSRQRVDRVWMLSARKRAKDAARLPHGV